ncbi:tRNA pseudouridine(55) synthase TruB [Ruminococcus sp. HUN007]|uniref:tRNA pseudouridine(55) synthase TruB n=1 Tax=Ruminococcus sp. HUN007 TaxID=1514668 RepID=UPI0005D24684|nr:tRNA pseudouridine(55) synthase TruB [Ruminococcus sp. HUN007]
MNGILCINKPQGFTSFDVVAKLRGILKTRKIGHAGTLDPMATGVLPVFVGNATKACDIMPDSAKAYRASFRLGEQTDTQDSSGTVLKKCEVTCSAGDIEKLIPEFTGDIMQIPPMYSAVSVNGKRLYELARQGIEVERQPRKINVSSLILEEYSAETGEGVLYIECSKGTYIRTIIHDIGIRLGCGGVMTALVRTQSNGFTLSDCLTLEEVQALADEGAAEGKLLPVESVFESYPDIHLDADCTKLYRNGVKLFTRKIGLRNSDENVRYRVFSDEGKFMGLAFVKDDCLRVFKNFAL